MGQGKGWGARHTYGLGSTTADEGSVRPSCPGTRAKLTRAQDPGSGGSGMCSRSKKCRIVSNVCTRIFKSERTFFCFRELGHSLFISCCAPRDVKRPRVASTARWQRCSCRQGCAARAGCCVEPEASTPRAGSRRAWLASWSWCHQKTRQLAFSAVWAAASLWQRRWSAPAASA